MLRNIVLLGLSLVCLLAAGPAVGQQNGELLRRGLERESQHDDLSLRPNLSTITNQDQSPTKVQYVNVNGLPVLVQFTYVGPPKILPIATADSYPEGSLINLICTVSGGQRNGLTLRWQMNGQDLDGDRTKYSMENLSIDGDDGDISILKIRNATHVNSGQYSCTAKNPLGQDSTSVNIVINGMVQIFTLLSLSLSLSCGIEPFAKSILINHSYLTKTAHQSSSSGPKYLATPRSV